MDYKVVLTPRAIEDLDGIVQRIAVDSADRARSFGHALLDKALAVATFPEKGRITPEENDRSVREVLHGDYRIIYEIYADRKVVYVLRLWHGARDKAEIFRSQEQ